MEITAAQVKAFRDRTGLPMMECKKALQEAEGNEDAAIEILRKAGKKTTEKRADRETDAGRIAVFTDPKTGTTAMVELLCESSPVASNDEFIALANGLAKQLATGPGAKTPEELLSQPSPNKPGTTLQQEYDDLVNKIREKFSFKRILRCVEKCGSYVHHNAAVGVIVAIEGDDTALARDICMHVASMKPRAISAADIDQAVVAKEREAITEEAKANNAGKPDNIIAKIVDGKMKTFLAESCLLDQPFVKDATKTVQQVCTDGKIAIKSMVHWILGGK
ncbi:MAG: translation elongation factor Ts [Thermoguttaceae bacterium]